MAQQVYGRNSEEPYRSRYGYNAQSPQKPVFRNYYPSGNSNPQRLVVAQVETVTREVVNEPAKESRGQLKREDEFINRMRDETTKATAEFNSKVLRSTDSDIDNQIHGGFNELGESDHHPRKVAELMSRVSNWRGVNGNLGYDRSRSNYDYTGNRGRTSEYGYEMRYEPRYGNGYSSGNPAATAGKNHMYRAGDQLQLDKLAVAEYEQAKSDGYSSGLPKRSLARGDTSSSTSTVVTNIDAVTKYKGSFV